MRNDITVVLNGFKRPSYLQRQVAAVINQSVKPADIFYWQNSVPGVEYDMTTSSSSCVSAYASHNFGVWARFAYALNARTEWVCVFDDDTIPGSRWFENCLEHQKTNPGLHGTIGVIFNHADYGCERRVGWDCANPTIEQVDIVGHSWFFHRDLLSAFWRELPPKEIEYIAGEDIHFSWMVQKYTNFKTWVPPHPQENQELWGSLDGWRLGGDNVSTAGNGGVPHMAKYLRYAYDNGFQLLLGDKVQKYEGVNTFDYHYK
jgi:hypothetical protein